MGRARIAAGRHRGGGRLDRRRRDAGHAGRLLPARRRTHHAHHGRPDGHSRRAAGDCPDGHPERRPGHRDHRHRHPRGAARRPPGARAGADDPRTAVHRGGRIGRHARAVDPAAPHPAQPPC
ncbi:hypothetical protein G6F22_020940 [Rhizopus arrhizus]|nr:hypothetical protein G6F22_020940 [Rhizopus arrhizus]